MAPSKPQELSAWERRKLYWKNVTSKSVPGDDVGQDPAVQKPPALAKAKTAVPAKPTASVKPQQASVRPKLTSAAAIAKPVAPRPSTSTSRPSVLTKVTAASNPSTSSVKPAVPARKHKLSVSEDPPNKRFKMPQPVPRRITVAAPVSRRSSFGARRRLTDIKPKPATIPAKPKPMTPIPQNRKRNYREVPSRVQTGLKRKPSLMPQRTPAPKPFSEIFPKAKPQVPKAVQKVGSGSENVTKVKSATETVLKARSTLRRDPKPVKETVPTEKSILEPTLENKSVTGGATPAKMVSEMPSQEIPLGSEATPKPTLRRQGTFELPATPARDIAADNKDTSTPGPVRRGSYTITPKPDNQDKTTQEEIVVEVGADMNARSTKRKRNGRLDSSLNNSSEDKVKDAEETVTAQPSKRKRGKAKKTENEKSAEDSEMFNQEPVMSTRSSRRRGRKTANNCDPNEPDNNLNVKLQLSDEENKAVPTCENNETTGEEKLEQLLTPKPLKNIRSSNRGGRKGTSKSISMEDDIPEKSILQSYENRRNTMVLSMSGGVPRADTPRPPPPPHVKTPKSVLKKMSSFRVATPLSSGRMSKGHVGDQENVVPQDAVLTPRPTTSKRSKNVSFHVGVNTSRVSITLPKTPRRELSLRQKLEKFMDEKGYSVSRHRHLRCFGADLSEAKRRDKSQQLHGRLSSPFRSSSPQLRDRKSVGKPLSSTTISPEASSEERISAILNDLKTLLLMGQPVEDGAEWLKQLEDHAPDMVELQASYWVVKALLTEQEGNYHRSLAIFTEAVERKVEPTDELSKALSDFMERVTARKNADNNGASAEFPPVNEEAGEAATPSVRTRSSRKGSAARRSIERKGGQPEDLGSTLIKYAVHDSSNVKNLDRLLRSSSTPKVLAVLTPVRRSVRLAPSSGRSTGRKSRRSLILTDLPKDLQDKVSSLPQPF